MNRHAEEPKNRLPMADFYTILECERTASDDEIKKSYRKLAMAYHPDRNGGSKDAEEKFKAITEAYDVLRDPQKRAAYDRYGEAGLRGGGGGGFHHVDLSEALNIFMRDFGGFSGLGDLFGQQGANPQQLSDECVASTYGQRHEHEGAQHRSQHERLVMGVPGQLEQRDWTPRVQRKRGHAR